MAAIPNITNIGYGLPTPLVNETPPRLNVRGNIDFAHNSDGLYQFKIDLAEDPCVYTQFRQNNYFDLYNGTRNIRNGAASTLLLLGGPITNGGIRVAVSQLTGSGLPAAGSVITMVDCIDIQYDPDKMNTLVGVNTSRPLATLLTYGTHYGWEAGMYDNASSSTYVGYRAGKGDSGGSTGTLNTALGYSALSAISSGSSNIAVGASAAASLTTGSNCICVGAGADCSAGVSSAIAIGPAATITGTKGISIGDQSSAANITNIGYSGSTTDTYIQGNVRGSNNIYAATTFISNAGNNSIYGASHLKMNTSNLLRFQIGLTDDEAKDDSGYVGSNLWISRYTNDTGGNPTYLGTSIFVKRSTGYVGINNGSPAQQLDVGGNVKASGIILPTTNGTPTTLTYYEEGNFSISVSGPINSTSITIYFTRVGNVVSWSWTGFFVIGNNTAASITSAAGSIPARLCPVTSGYGPHCPCFVIQGSSPYAIPGCLFINPNGAIDILRAMTTGYDAFPASTTQYYGMDSGTCTYRIT